MPEITRRDFAAILAGLHTHQVDFIVVGGVAAALEGAPLGTFDLDIVHSAEPANIRRLVAALDSLGAPREAVLGLPAATRFGPLDTLGMIGRFRSYGDLLPHAHDIEVADGLRVQVLDLETLIAIKEEVAGEKDLAVLPTMRRTLEEKRRMSGS